MSPVGVCPGCSRVDVPLLPPRRLTRNGTIELGWRRRAHAVQGDLGEPGAVRCRYPVQLSSGEIPLTAVP